MCGGAVFATVYAVERETTGRETNPDPLWRRLENVREGQVHEVANGLWVLGLVYTPAEGSLDDLEKHLADRWGTRDRPSGQGVGPRN